MAEFGRGAPRNADRSSVTFRVATVGDIPEILALQDAYLAENLSQDARQSGFLSARFAAAQFAAMVNDLGIVVATGNDGAIVGYLCASRCDDSHSSPIIARMLELLDVTPYRGRTLRSRRPFLYGPVCIHEAHRGRGVLAGLYELLTRHVAGRFDTGVAFVAKANPRSLHAHVHKLGMNELCEFEAGAASYALLAFEVSA